VKRSWLLPLLLGCLVATSACSGGDADAKETKTGAGKDGKAKVDEAVPVEVATLGTGEIEAVLRFSTNLEADSEVGVYSQAARQVRQLFVEEGARVAKGQVLLRLQEDEQRTALAKVKSQLEKARREYERQKRAYEQELISEQAFSQATFDVEQLQLAVDEAERQLSYTEVRAPISGTVTRRLVGIGDHITPNQHLFDIVDFNSIVARVHVPEKELPRLKTGQAVRISAPALGGETVQARISLLSPVVDPKSGTVKVTVKAPDYPGLRPGMYVDVELVTALHKDALLVPKRALVYDNDQVFVYRLKGANRVERLLVRPELEDKENVKPMGGVSAGDKVVVAGQAGLKDGALVRLARAGA
jgi:membrane fusion protein (multidrug efflux system)